MIIFGMKLYSLSVIRQKLVHMKKALVDYPANKRARIGAGMSILELCYNLSIILQILPLVLRCNGQMDDTQCSKPHVDAPLDGSVGRDIRITKTVTMQIDGARLTSPLTLNLALEAISEHITAQRHVISSTIMDLVSREGSTALLDMVEDVPVISTLALKTGTMKIVVMQIPYKLYSPMALMEGTR